MKPYYERDGISIYHGDCLAVLADLELPALATAAVVADPPYNAGKNYGTGTNDRQPWEEWAQWIDERFDAWDAKVPDTFMFLSQTAYRQYVRHGRRDIYWSAIWFKPFACAVSAAPFMPHWEHIAYWGPRRKVKRKKDGPFNGGMAWGSDVIQANVEIGPGRSHAGGHPTPKPMKLLRKFLAQLDHDMVIDPFCGSGTTLRAAKDLGKRAIGIEIEERWCEVAAKRLSQEVMHESE